MKYFYLIMLIAFSSNAAIYPTENWHKSNEKLSQTKIQKLEKLLFSKEDKFFTKSFLIIKDGKLVYQKDEDGFSSSKPQKMWSVTKTVAGILIGIAEKQGLLSKEDSLKKYYPKMSEELKIKDLLHMSSGLDWKETYEGNPLNSDVLKMLYISNFKDMATFVSSKKQKYKPGTNFNYSSGETNLLMSTLKKKISKSDYETFPWKNLFDKLGVTTSTWERDHSGNFVGSSYLYISPNDLARIGHLYLNKGKWKEEEIVSKEWVQFSTELAPAVLTTKLEGKKKWDSYGAHWWLNSKLPKAGKKHKNAPESTFMALGHHGQAMMIVPQENMIIVRTSNDRDGRFDRNQIFEILFGNKYLDN